MSPDITVVIADDHPIFRQGLRQAIESDARLQVLAEADDSATAIARVRETAPRVAVLDIEMPGGGGIDVARAIRSARLPVEIVFLTLHKDEQLFNSAIDLGVRGYVLKDSAVRDVVAGIKAAAAGEHFISPLLSSYLLERRDRATALAATVPSVDRLTPTERRVLKLLGEYRTSKDIADELCVSVRTVEHHRANVATKLSLKGRLALLQFAVTHHSQL